MKFYRVATIVLLFLVILLSLKLYQKSNQSGFISDEILNSFEDINNEKDVIDVLQDYEAINDLFNVPDTIQEKFKMDISQWSAEPIEMDEAKGKKGDFNSWNRRNKRFKLEPYGFSFGKQRITEMLKEIETINNDMGKAHDSLKIQGIRVYLVRKSKRRPRKNLDLMLIPVRGNGDDYWHSSYKFKINSDTSYLYLNTSAPCPNNCDDSN